MLLGFSCSLWWREADCGRRVLILIEQMQISPPTLCLVFTWMGKTQSLPGHHCHDRCRLLLVQLMPSLYSYAFLIRNASSGFHCTVGYVELEVLEKVWPLQKHERRRSRSISRQDASPECLRRGGSPKRSRSIQTASHARKWTNEQMKRALVRCVIQLAFEYHSLSPFPKRKLIWARRCRADFVVPVAYTRMVCGQESWSFPLEFVPTCEIQRAPITAKDPHISWSCWDCLTCLTLNFSVCNVCR